MADDGGTQELNYQVTIPDFEGPLDLLLHLVKKHELDILHIPIGFITEKYLEQLELMRALNVDLAGDYLVMAATLAHLKSRELLPSHELDDALVEDGEEVEDPRQELIRRLLEYQRYKEVAARLGDRPTLGREVYVRGGPVALEPEAPNESGLVEVSVFALLTSLGEVLKRTGDKLSYDVVVDRISITDRINEIVDRLTTMDSLRFSELLRRGAAQEISRHDVVVTFLSILEMTRLKMIRVLQSTVDGEIYLTRTGELRQVEDAGASYA